MLQDFKRCHQFDDSIKVENSTENEVRIPHSAANINKHRYVEGKHYIALERDELRAFNASHEIHDNLKYAHIAYFWTEKGALLHAKSLNTDKAWEVYDYLVDFYFRAKEKQKPAHKMIPQTPRQTGTDIAPMFCDFIARLPIEALDAMERAFREDESKAVRMAALSILAEKMKRQIV